MVVMGRNVTIAASPWNAIAVRKGPRLLNTLFRVVTTTAPHL